MLGCEFCLNLSFLAIFDKKCVKFEGKKTEEKVAYLLKYSDFYT